MAGSGTCRHPLRRDLQNMVFVRKSELGCRNDWDQDLWEPAETARPEAIAARAVPPNGSVPEADPFDDADGTDTLAAIAVSTRPRSSRAPLVPGEQVMRLSDQPSDEENGPRLVDHRVAAQEARRRRQEALAQERMRALDSAPIDTPRSQPVPPTRRVVVPDTAEEDFAPIRSNRVAPAQPRTPAVRTDFPHSTIPSTPKSEPVGPRAFGAMPSRAIAPEPAAEPPIVRPRPPVPPNVRDPGAATSSAAPTGTPTRSGSTEPFEIPSRDRQPVQAPDAHPAHELRRSSGAQMPAPAPPNVRGVTLPQCCSTCRDFRPADGGQRGWCHNRFAFEHPRMVHREELACAGTIGNWWIPSDEWWLQKADFSHHTRPTPIVDEYLSRLMAERLAERRREAR